MPQTTTSIDEQRERLEAVGQGHVLAFADGLDGAQRDALASQLAGIDIEKVPGWVDEFVKGAGGAHAEDAGEVSPAPLHRLDGDWDREAAREAGEALIRAGKVAAFRCLTPCHTERTSDPI